jgi:hypothetical protein
LDDPALAPVMAAVREWLAAHEPYPALALDRRWTLVAANTAIWPLLEGVAPELLQPPVNVLRLSLHPDGLAPRIVNLAEWRTHLFERLRRQAEASGDPALEALRAELIELSRTRVPPGGGEERGGGSADASGAAHRRHVLSLIGATAVFGTPLDVTLSELMLETLLPAEAATRAWFVKRAAS